MSASTSTVLAIFRRYRVGPHQMLFLYNLDASAQAALTQLIDDGFIVKEKPKNAYCLTASGYAAVQAL